LKIHLPAREANSPWRRRIHRANDLIAKHAFASEILGFYIHVASFQETLYDELETKRSAGVPPALQFFRKARQQDAGATPPPAFDATPLIPNFSAFLTLLEAKAPAHFAQVARDLKNSPAESWSDLLAHCWSSTAELLAPQEFLALAFLQPCAEFVRSSAVLQLASYTLAQCPLCHRKPAAGILRQQGDGGRNLLCGFCLTEWEYRCAVCPGCEEQDHAKLPVYTAESFPHIRVECCDSCRTYLKSIDLTKNALANPLVDELAFVPLDLWAQERGYAKLRTNLLGM
jgi:FdhE protein